MNQLFNPGHMPIVFFFTRPQETDLRFMLNQIQQFRYLFVFRIICFFRE